MASCRSCGAPIVWARFEKSGKNTPLDEQPTPRGNLVSVSGKVRVATDEDRHLARPLYTNHFSTCPDASDWRSKR